MNRWMILAAALGGLALLLGCPEEGDDDDDDDTTAGDDDTGSDDDVTGDDDGGDDDSGDDDTAPVDGDGDGFTDDVDCDDTDATIHPDADEVCDDEDNDCDGLVDDEDDSVDAPLWYSDGDHDSYGAGKGAASCDTPPDTSSQDGDCDDTNDTVYPGAPELCDGLDNDCDGFDEGSVAGTYLGPDPYLDALDSPWDPATFSWFHLEDVEDDLIDTPGLVPANGYLASSYGYELVDSVDGDDGDPTDGGCNPCQSWYGSGTLTFTFDEVALGGLPTTVGVVWTDGLGEIYFEASWACGSLGTVGPFSDVDFPDNVYNGTSGEDRFFGVTAPVGVTSFTISNTAGGIEVDHIQYGLP